MRYRKLDLNGDMIFGSGRNDYYTDIEAVQQACKTRMLLLRGEWWENQADGLPFFQQIGGTFNNLDAIKKIIRERLQGTEKVVSVTNLEVGLNKDTRVLSFSANVQTEYGNFEMSMYL